MDWIVLLKTIALCLISVVIEIISFSKDGKKWFENLKQPHYAISLKIWYVVGAVYYLICGIIAYRLFSQNEIIFTPPVILLSCIMIVNGLTNFILFKFRSLKMFYWVLFPFIGLFGVLIYILFAQDVLSFLLACVYFVWLVYDVYYFNRLMVLNK